MGFGAMEIIGKYPAHWRASTHPTALMVGKMSRLISYPFQAHCRDISPTLPGYRANVPRVREKMRTPYQAQIKPKKPDGGWPALSDKLCDFLVLLNNLCQRPQCLID